MKFTRACEVFVNTSSENMLDFSGFIVNIFSLENIASHPLGQVGQLPGNKQKNRLHYNLIAISYMFDDFSLNKGNEI